MGLIQNNEKELHRLSKEFRAKRVREVAQTYFNGILEYILMI
jgi:hypothetical protein